MKTIFRLGGGSLQSGAPGGMPAPHESGGFWAPWHVAHVSPGEPWPSGPRRTFIACGRSTSKSGASPGMWQFWQRGCWNTAFTVSNAAIPSSFETRACADMAGVDVDVAVQPIAAAASAAQIVNRWESFLFMARSSRFTRA